MEYTESRAHPERRFIGVRLTIDDQPRLWIDVDDWWSRIWMLWSPTSTESPLPPIGVRECKARTTEGWTWWWLDRLLMAHERGHPTPLHPGRWWCGPLRSHRLSIAQTPTLTPAVELERFEDRLFPTRLLSPLDDARVKAWRKRIEDGQFPPILAVYCSVSEGWLILDGHDRLVAALDLGVTPQVIGLTHTCPSPLAESLAQQAQARAAFDERASKIPWARATPDVRQHFNHAAQRVYLGEHDALHRTRFWALHGGVKQWCEEVRTASQDLTGRHAKTAEEMLWADPA